MIPKEKLLWTEQDEIDAINFVNNVESGKIKVMNFKEVDE